MVPSPPPATGACVYTLSERFFRNVSGIAALPGSSHVERLSFLPVLVNGVADVLIRSPLAVENYANPRRLSARDTAVNDISLSFSLIVTLTYHSRLVFGKT